MKTITDIKENKRNPQRVSIYTDGTFLLACHKELVYKKGLKKGLAIDEALLLSVAKEDAFLRAREVALRTIEHAMKTQNQVAEKLREKDFEEETIQRVMDLLKEYQLMDDARYTEVFLKEKLRSRGIRKAKYELMQKGVDKELVEEVLSETATRELEEASCLKLAKKKVAQLKRKEEDPYKLKSKAYGYLVGKGYEYDLVTSTLQKVLENHENFH